MMSLQSNPQLVVYHLYQLSNSLSASTTEMVNSLRTMCTHNVDSPDILCKQSLEESARNCSGKMIMYLPKIYKQNKSASKKFHPIKNTSNGEEFKLAVQLLSPIQPLRLKKKYQAPWEISFISANTFEENKRNGFQRGPSSSPHTTTYIMSSRNLHPALLQSSSLACQKRGFKTERIANREKERNSGVFSQIANLFRPSKPEIAIKPNMDKFADTKTVEAVTSAWMKIYEGGFKAGESAEQRKRNRGYWIIGLVLLSTFVSVARLFLKNFPFREQIKIVSPEEIDVTFADVRGSEEVKKELETVVNFLKNPKKYAALGARLPKGVLLVGEPGVGKTLLARAVAGEARVPFFYASGSEFDEILVGEGARRIRNLFRIAKANAPCVIFLDEIDSVGAKRTKSSVHPYANQSINQLLSEMDGFQANEGVVVLAATNRASELDKALVRPGRFDMSIQVPYPRTRDRRDIIQYYLQKIACRNIDIELIVKLTAGWNGANLENLLNWAAIIAATENSEYVNMQHITNAFDRLVLGVSWGSGDISDSMKETRRVAYHEAGHTLVSLLTPGCSPIHKVTIEARGSSLGHTASIRGDELLPTKAEFKAQLDKCFGGQVAEELIYGSDEVSTGCASDLENATEIASTMVRKYGMGVINRAIHDSESLSGGAQDKIDTDIDKLLTESKERAKNVLLNHITDLHKIAGALLEYKTLTRADLMQLLGKTDEVESSESSKP
ncbi:ATP-dependent zinc metalloprotease YME1 homolog isoform X1 [Frankliniella occidentalis]|uniref:ATP-dependent zinc metalloprotease YME1 homolog isoform X1 n=1 Tax=Frankliniella occidentalis TaxID=133901 RepID=A0A6J1SL93_FRAOC|nr:ATP-dependent zinc metalloprotease YME1 homolog isoform X1 [Frankliniella occidentalis]